jgi:hypothetical protein
MTYEDQLGAIVSRISKVHELIHYMDDDMKEVRNQLQRLEDDLATLRAQIARPE